MDLALLLQCSWLVQIIRRKLQHQRGRHVMSQKKLKPQKPSGWKHSFYLYTDRTLCASPYLDWVFQSNNGIDIWSAENMYCTPNSVAMIPSLQGIVVAYFEEKKEINPFFQSFDQNLTHDFWDFVQSNIDCTCRGTPFVEDICRKKSGLLLIPKFIAIADQRNDRNWYGDPTDKCGSNHIKHTK